MVRKVLRIASYNLDDINALSESIETIKRRRWKTHESPLLAMSKETYDVYLKLAETHVGLNLEEGITVVIKTNFPFGEILIV